MEDSDKKKPSHGWLCRLHEAICGDCPGPAELCSTWGSVPKHTLSLNYLYYHCSTLALWPQRTGIGVGQRATGATPESRACFGSSHFEPFLNIPKPSDVHFLNVWGPMARRIAGAFAVTWRSVCCALCHEAIIMSRLVTNDTLHFVSIEIASEWLVWMHLKAYKSLPVSLWVVSLPESLCPFATTL